MILQSRAGFRPTKHAVTKAPRGQQRRAIPAARSAAFPGQSVLALLPIVVFFYVLVVLPLMGGDGLPRIENMLFWPTLAVIVLVLAFYNHSLIDKGFFWSLPIACFIAYLIFAGASITWAFSPDYSFTRYSVQLLAFVILVIPFSLPISTDHMIKRLHVCCAIAVALNAIYVLTTPGTPIGHHGYFIHKQELGMLCGATIILAMHELLFRGWRRVFAVLSMCLTVWVIVASQSKGSTAFLLMAVTFSGFILVACKYLRTTPAFVLAGAVLAFGVFSRFVSDPVGRIAFKLYGDATLTGRTTIWEFINYQISHRSWFGYGFHSYWGVPDSPHNQAPGFVKDMVSTHSGYLDVKLDTGHIGYWIFLAFVYASLHVLGRVRSIDPTRAWVLLSLSMYVLLLNLIESIWTYIIPLWVLYLIVVGESVRLSRSQNVTATTAQRPVGIKRHPILSVRRLRPN
jgi:exopolysaccharide production protein ExoQ